MDISRVVARANVPQSQASQVKLGDPATIKLVDTNVEVPGKVTVVSPATDAASTTVQIWVQADNPGEKLKPGASVHVSIITETIHNAAIVPASAILPGEDGGTAVLTVGPDSVAHLRKVDIGVRLADKVQIVRGVNPGDDVVTVGGLGVEDKACKGEDLSTPARPRNRTTMKISAAPGSTADTKPVTSGQTEIQMSQISARPPL